MRDFLEDYATANLKAAGKASRETFSQRMTDLLLKDKKEDEDEPEEPADAEADAQDQS